MMGISRTHCEEIIHILDVANGDEIPKPMYCWTVIGGIPGMYVSYIILTEDTRILYTGYTEASGRSTHKNTALYYVSDNKLSPIEDADIQKSKFVLSLEDLRTIEIPILPEVSA